MELGRSVPPACDTSMLSSRLNNTAVGPSPCPKTGRPRLKATGSIEKSQPPNPPSPFRVSAWLLWQQMGPFATLKKDISPQSPFFLRGGLKSDCVGGKQGFPLMERLEQSKTFPGKGGPFPSRRVEGACFRVF